MKRGDKRGSVKLKNAQVGIDHEDDSTFTITVDSKTFHFQARDTEERKKWLGALQEARDLHTFNYCLLHQTARLLDHPTCPSEFTRRIVEADAYLQILIEYQQQLSTEFAESDDCNLEIVTTVAERLQCLIDLVKKTIVCLQFAKESICNTESTFAGPNQFNSPDLGMSTVNSSPRYSSAPSSPKQSSVTLNKFPTQLSPNDDSHSLSTNVNMPSNERLSSRSQRSVNDHQVGGSVAVEVDGNASPSISESRSDSPQPSSEDASEEASMMDDDEDDEYFDSIENPVNSTYQDPIYKHSSANLQNSPRTSFTANTGQFNRNSIQKVANSDAFDTSKYIDDLYDNPTEAELGSVKSHGSVIYHLISQLRIGMDLSRVTLPTFILERRSTLEMFADFIAHADIWSAIPTHTTPRGRMIACVRWYLSAFHAGRGSSGVKKPYNPILGEFFKCFYYIGDTEKRSAAVSADDAAALRKSGPVPSAPNNSVVLVSEQVSHHPPISSFYAESVDHSIMLDGHLWTKSNFYGLSIGVDMIGPATITLIDHDEEYVVTFPSAYGRSILTVPWFELGGKTSIVCAKTGFSANVEFRTRSLYHRKVDLIYAEVFDPSNGDKPFLTVDGKWNDKMWARWSDDSADELFIDTRNMPVMRKCVGQRSEQTECESRRLWEEVTTNLKSNNIDAATMAKHRIEQQQRDMARQRQAVGEQWSPVHFQDESGQWAYRNPLSERIAKKQRG